MAVSRAKKIEQVEKLGAELKNVSSLIVATYSKLTVAQEGVLHLASSLPSFHAIIKETLAMLRNAFRSAQRWLSHAGRSERS